MKIKLSWLFFLPLTVISIAISVHYIQYSNYDYLQSVVFNNDIMTNFFLAVGVMFVILLILNLMDKETNKTCIISQKNVFAGLFSLVASGLLFYDSYNQINNLSSTVLENLTLQYIDLVSCILGGIGFVVVGIFNMQSKPSGKKTSVVMVLPTIWVAAQLGVLFMSYARESIHAVNMMDLIYTGLCAIAISNIMCVYARITDGEEKGGRNPVKAVFLYSMPAIALIFSYFAMYLTSNIATGRQINFTSDVKIFEFIAVALFMLSFVIQLSSNLNGGNSEKRYINEFNKRNTKPNVRTVIQAGNNSIESGYIFPTGESVDEEEHSKKVVSQVDDIIYGLDD